MQLRLLEMDSQIVFVIKTDLQSNGDANTSVLGSAIFL